MQTLSPAFSSPEESRAPCSCLILTVMPVSAGVYLPVIQGRLRVSLPQPAIVERVSLLSSKGSSDKKRVKTPESLSPEGRNFSFFVQFLLCCLSLLLSFLLSFSSMCIILSPAGRGRIQSSQGPMMEGNLSSSEYKQLLLTFETVGVWSFKEFIVYRM